MTDVSAPRTEGADQATAEAWAPSPEAQEVEPTGVLVIRVWTEATDPAAPSFRARITWRPDVTASAEQIAAARSVEEAVATASSFLASFDRGGPRAPLPPPT
jgi:hypothetical protein